MQINYLFAGSPTSLDLDLFKQFSVLCILVEAALVYIGITTTFCNVQRKVHRSIPVSV